MAIRPRVTVQPGEGLPPPEPFWVRSIQAILPSFSDELAAMLLIALGLMSFFTLLSASSGALGTAWASSLRETFGLGAYIVSAVILSAGGIILVPHLGVEVRINWWRVIFGEVGFVLALGLIHLFTRFGLSPDVGQEQAFAAALDGAGGGFVGWAVQEVTGSLFGDWVAALILGGLIAVTGGVALGVSREHLLGWLERLRGSLIAFAWTMEGRRPVPVVASEGSNGNGDANAPPVQFETGAGSTLQPDGSGEFTMPQGRPSVVTGETGTGPLVVRRANIAFKRVSTVRLAVAHDDDQEKPPREVKYRFTLKHEAPEKRKVRRRPADLPPAEVLDTSDYALPEDDGINLDAQTIEDTIDDFGMQVEVVGVQAGPTVTQYAVQPFSQSNVNAEKVVQRVRVTRVAALAEDLALALSAPRVRIQAPVPGTNYIGVEVPNPRPGIVSLRPVIESERYYKIKSPLAIALGREVGGKPFAADLAGMPHLLIGGTTGSGKSVCLSSLTTCLVYNNRPDELRLIMIDPKMVELVRFNGLPHLLGRVEVELDRIIGVLRWVVREMDQRYRLMEEAQARNILVYNQMKRKKDRLPYIVVLIDELAELMTEYPDETEHLVTRLAQMARATGIHLVVATQRPSTDIVTGLIKANFPARIAFAVASGIDSRVIIDSVGAEDLIGRGDMLFYASDAAGPIRLQGCFVSDAEMERVVEFWRNNWAFEEGEDAPWERSLTRAAVLDETDQMLEEAIRLVQKEGEASTSFLQRKLNVSYPRAGRMMDSLYKMGVVGDPQAGGRVRRVMIGPDIDATTYIVTWRNNHP
jgi:DNA segregation ATPase FtsK/SpoIIIE, S-DNA-T family